MFTFFCDTSLLKGQNKQCKDIFRRLIYLIVKFVPPKCTNSPSKLKFYMVFAFNLKFLHTTEFVWSPWQIWVSWHLWYLCIAEVFVVGYFVLQGYDDMRHMLSDISDICVLPRPKFFWWVIFVKERSRQSCRLFEEFLQQNHPNKSETSCFRESCCFSSFFCNKVMQQMNYSRNSTLSKYWHCNASCFNHVNRVSIIAIWRDLKWEWWSWFCW